MKEIENLSISELEAIAQDSSVKVPAGLGEAIRTELDTLAFFSEPAQANPRRLRYAAGIAASFVLLAGIGLGIDSQRHRPKDTFTDPHQAYAMLESSLSFISSKMDKGVASITQETETVFNKTNTIMDKIK